ncbi:hypothetical protein SAMN05216533_2303 [Streptomyces sp. Ag109_O5-10]|nr:hypothetical protein SAMN05216533_2303 [Streptomyces sp. Ag109_O5-10]
MAGLHGAAAGTAGSPSATRARGGGRNGCAASPRPAGLQPHPAGGGDDGTLRLWDPETGRELRTLHAGSLVFGLCAVPLGDRTLLASCGGGENELQLRDATTGEQLRALEGHTGPVWGGRCVVPLGDRTHDAHAPGEHPRQRFLVMSSGHFIGAREAGRIHQRPRGQPSAAAPRPRDRSGSRRRPARQAADPVRQPAPAGCLFSAATLIWTVKGHCTGRLTRESRRGSRMRAPTSSGRRGGGRRSRPSPLAR